METLKKEEVKKKVFTKEDLSRIIGGSASSGTAKSLSVNVSPSDIASARSGAQGAAASDNAT